VLAAGTYVESQTGADSSTVPCAFRRTAAIAVSLVDVADVPCAHPRNVVDGVAAIAGPPWDPGALTMVGLPSVPSVATDTAPMLSGV